ncbi:PBP1A family penicillin-binding protein [Patescibacteria group bacterium]|nr:MAG: PBP1A family penicillin-binding protein [Patescibacteria group bacterium]
MPIPHLQIKKPDRETFRRAAETSKRRLRLFFRRNFTGPRLRTLLGISLLAGVLSVVVGGIALAMLFAWVSRALPDPANLASRQVAQSTKIFDREGKELLYEIHGEEKRTIIKLSDVPETVKQATIAIEDKAFYEHKGFRVTSLIRAILVNLIKGRRAQGGSTITQQLVKNAILTGEKTFARKFKELILAYEIERRFSKDQILELYFNQIPYGANAYGIEAAAQTYFGQSARELDLLESALLAALPKAPTYYSPYGTHRDELLRRTRLVLDRMAEEGFIGKGEAESAKNSGLLGRVKERREAIKAPHFVFYVRELLTERYGEKMVEQGGLKVLTTLDWKKQQAAEQAVADGIKKVEDAGGGNAALVALNPQNGEILAMVGSRDYFDAEHDGAVNVTLRPRQPGSSFKPVVYAAGLEKGYTPGTVLDDVDTIFNSDGREYHPRDYDLKERGLVTARQALAGSLNIPAVQMLYLTGVGRVLDFAERLGYTTLADRSRFGLALVLGGAEVKPLEHAAAFAAFAADGLYRRPEAVLRVEYQNGTVLDERQPDAGTRVMDSEIARNISDMLSDNAARAFIFGGRNFLTLPGRTVAAKTGTTNDFRDAWTAGYTPSLAAVVWAGNNDNKEMKRGADGSQIAAPIWQQFMKEALKETPVEGFAKPAPITTGKPALDGKTDLLGAVKIDRATGLLATELTPPSFVVEKTFSDAHTILHYVDKENPRAPAPENPQNDPEYNRWETALQEWIKKNTSSTPEKFTPPTGTDNIHTEANRPTISIISPAENSVINSRVLEVAANASAPRGVNRVEYRIDGALIGVAALAPFGGTFPLPGKIGVGFHTLEARALDDVDNAASAQVQINVTAPPPDGTVFWASPSAGAVLTKNSFPLMLSASLASGNDFKQANFVVVSADGAYRHTAGTVSNPGGNLMVAKWLLPPAPGSYYLRLELTRADGATLTSPEIIPVSVQ